MKGSSAVHGPWELPQNWSWERIDDVAPVNPKRRVESLGDEELVSFVPMAAVSEESGKIDVSQHRPARDVRKGYTRFQTGDVLFAKITPCMENGKIAVVPDLQSPFGAGSTEFHVLVPEAVEARFLFYWLSRQSFRHEAEFNMTGTAGQKRVPPDYLRNALIPLPDIETQRRIVTRIDELFSELDDGEEELARVRVDLEAYRKALLKAAVTGELTADWRAANMVSETGPDLLSRILKEKRERWSACGNTRSKRYIEPIGARDDHGVNLPAGWATASTDQLALHAVYGTSCKCSELDEGLLVLRMGDIQDGRLVIGKRKFAPVGERVPLLAKGDVLFNRTNSPELVGKTAVFDLDIDCSFASYLVALRLEGMRPQFFSYWMNSAYGRAWIDRNRSQQVGQANVSAGKLLGMSLPLPPLSEQSAIVELVEDLMADAENMVVSEVEAVSGSAGLRQSILATAFRGELVQ